LISWLRFGETELDPADCGMAITMITGMEQGLQYLDRSSSDEEVLAILMVMASTIQVKMPEETGQKTYIHLLHHLPPHVLEAAAYEVLRTLTVKVMPLPAEILATAAVQEWIVVQNHWPKLCLQWRRRLEKISTAKGD
jgi:hypothetical protein